MRVEGVAHMVERSLSMREVLGSIPSASKLFFTLFILCKVVINKLLMQEGRGCARRA